MLSVFLYKILGAVGRLITGGWMRGTTLKQPLSSRLNCVLRQAPWQIADTILDNNRGWNYTLAPKNNKQDQLDPFLRIFL